jgi:hypothetical protein
LQTVSSALTSEGSSPPPTPIDTSSNTSDVVARDRHPEQVRVGTVFPKKPRTYPRRFRLRWSWYITSIPDCGKPAQVKPRDVAIGALFYSRSKYHNMYLFGYDF